MHHSDGTDCRGVHCPWKNDGGHDLVVATVGRINIVVESSANIVLAITQRERWTITNVDALREALDTARIMRNVMYD